MSLLGWIGRKLGIAHSPKPPDGTHPSEAVRRNRETHRIAREREERARLLLLEAEERVFSRRGSRQ